ncbi:N-glycosylase/DNA lyase [Thermocrinis jamiesonii]|jgi:Thermostable 8-oxoguanine DNA glycosylase|uniref:N-glycosylase/DNA lyase n=1 Tax=Thermocrinis jamiesonii TaxID=1302351 RepID=UPI000497C8B2|nr:N-glycosylase/DNA lyase [Thermocrinis jamiesonii]
MFEDVLLAKEKVGTFVKRRLEEFKNLGTFGKTTFDFRPFLDVKYEADIFSELCFCILTANSSATIGIKAQKEIGIEGFKSMSVEEITYVLSSLGHRFAQQRAERIVKARDNFHKTLELLKAGGEPSTLRDLLSDTCSKYKVEGFGMKEASHFLRNIGYDNISIVDRHIFRFLKEKGLIPDYKTMTRKIYLQAEEALKGIAEKLGLSLAELDLYVFYLKTGKVLK